MPETGSPAAVTQAMWRFLRNPRVTLPALIAPLRQAGRDACAVSSSEFVLLAHDWCNLDYASHSSKDDRRQLTHEHDIGYDLTTALLVDAQTGAPLAPMQVQLKTADAVYSTAEHPAEPDDHHLDQLQPTKRPTGFLALGSVFLLDYHGCRVDRQSDPHESGHAAACGPASHTFRRPGM